MKRFIILCIILMLLTACQPVEEIASEQAVDINNLELINPDSTEKLSNIIEGTNKVLIFYDYGTIPCKCSDVPENYSDLVEKYKDTVSFRFMTFLETPDEYQGMLPYQQMLDIDMNEIATHEGDIKKEEIIKMIESYLNE